MSGVLVSGVQTCSLPILKSNGNAIRPCNVIEHQGGLWVAVRNQHTQPVKGGAYLQVELKNLRDNRKLNERFRSSETVERVRLDQRSEEHTSELQSLMRISYAVFCLKKKQEKQ